MSAIEIKSFDSPDEVIDKFNNAKIEAVNVGGQR
ncbi:MAG: cupin, partial [Actinomycetales bacterium]|nr:cupin [Actinomycetales bacterium]